MYPRRAMAAAMSKLLLSPVHALSNGAAVPAASASLIRNSSDVFGSMSTSQLTPGHVITFWWVIYNNPGANTYSCAHSRFPNADSTIL